MRRNVNLRSVLATLLFVTIAAAVSFAQSVPVHPIDDPVQRPTVRPHPTLPPPLALPTQAANTGAKPGATPAPANGGAGSMNALLNSRLGPKIPLSALPALPAKTAANTMAAGGRHPMAATDASIMYTTMSGCSSTVGYIFNIGCTIDFQLAYCNPSNSSANCITGTTSITRTDTFQDYYIDANSATAQTIGPTYVPSTTTPAAGSPYTCSSASTCTYGPARQLTLSNAGTVVLASYDVTQAAWVAVVYITVGSASALETFSDTQRLNPTTSFAVPPSGTNTVYMTIGNAQYSDVYAIYIENTSVNASCTGVIGPTPAGASAGLCNPMSITGVKALSSGNLYMQWTFGAGTNWTALTTGTYSLVAYDQTAGKRVAQTQISLTNSSSAIGVTLQGVGGNASPAPAPTGTPSTRFAFDNTADASTLNIVQNYTGLTVNHKYCFSFADPQGRVYQDYSSGTEKFTCWTATSSSIGITHSNVSSEQPDYFAPNTYTVQVCDFSSGSPCTMVASQAFQILGYHVTTNFTDSTGSTNLGTSLVVPKGASAPGGIYFLNDGDTYYGAGNGDTVSALMYSTANSGTSGDGSYLTLSCGLSCTQTVKDSAGQTWYVYELQNNGGANAYTTLEVCPTSWGTTCSSPSGSQSLPVNGSITVPGITFYPPPGSSNCTGGNCQAPTSILPADGQTWSGYGSAQSTVLNYFTNSNGNTYTGTGSFAHLGIVPSGCGSTGCSSGFSGTVTAPCTPSSSGYGGREQHGYFTNLTQALYASNEPFSPSSGQADVYCVKVTNNSTNGTITGIAFTLPSTYAGAGTTVWSVDADSASGGSLCSGGNTCWAQDTTSGKCPAGANFCIKPVGVNPGIQLGASQTVYIDVQNLPSSSFGFAEVSELVYNPVTYSLTPDATCCTSPYLNTIPVSSTAPTQTTIDALALGAYSLNASYMTPLFNPTSEGTSTSNTVNISLKNTSTAQDTNPDFVDAVLFEFPNSTYLGTAGFAPTGLTTGWSYLGYVSPGVGGGTTVDYWFGLCTAQYSPANGPLTNPTSTTTNSLPRYAGAGGGGCTAAAEQYALSPGSTFSFNAPVTTPSTAGTITSAVYAHGADGNGWSKSTTFSLTVAATSATSGFSRVGTYGSPSSVPANTTPQISTDSNTTYGNSYVYTITNTSGAGHNLTSATITVPGKDSSGALPSDGTAWTITGAPAISGTTYGCTISTSANNGSATTAGANGTITIGGGSCSIPPSSTLTISFSAKAPYTVNDQYQFPAIVNGTIGASEAWVGDQYVQIVLGASLVVTVAPAQNMHGYAYAYSCPTCTFIPASNTINFGTIAAGGSATGTDVVLLDVYTNASTPEGWTVYVTQQNAGNPTAASYLQTSVDNSSSSGCPTGSGCISYQPQTGTTYGTTAYTAIPVTTSASSGLVIGSSAGGTAATRLPFEFSNNYRVLIPAGGNTSPSTSTVTYTFIAN
ncbi:MAG TPA: hypothetical protein VJP85_11115 [Candidatus Baltobacteraceae bacterium]|nr:hypothetical protein [Candidatus Baltobacteraceae bacterium]